VAVTFDASAPTSAASWSHTNGGNAIVVGVIWDSGTDVVTAVTYGGVALTHLGSISSDNSGNGGISLWGRVGGLPSGSNTVSVTTGSTSTFGGSMSFAGADSFGTAQTFFGAVAPPASVNFSGTNSNALIAAASCFGGANGGGTFSATGAATQRFGVIGNNGGSASNSEGETAPSSNGTVTFGWSTTASGQDFWSMVAVEVLPPAGSTSGPNSPTVGTDLGGGSGSWANPGNIIADDGSSAVWTVI